MCELQLFYKFALLPLTVLIKKLFYSEKKSSELYIFLMKNQKLFSQFEKRNKQTNRQNGKFGEFYSGKKPDCTQKPTKAFF